MNPVNDAPAKVAVIVRTKNRVLLLRRAISGVLEQTYRDVQLCIVNDGGDREPIDKLVAEYAERATHPIQVVHNESSRGVGGAANAGIEATSSTYLALHDDDDTWHPQFLERTIGLLDGDGGDGVMTRTEVVFETVTGNEITIDRTETLASEIHAVSLFQMLRRNVNPPISFLYRRSIHTEVGPYDESLPVLEDWDFYLRFLARKEIAFIDGEPLAFWHHREGSTGSMSNTVVSGSADHEYYNLVVRDRYLRDGVDGPLSLGPVLFLAELQHRTEQADDQRIGDLNARLVDSQGILGHLRIKTDGIGEQLDAIVSRMDYLNDLQSRRLAAQIEQLENKLDRIEGLVSLATPKAKLAGLARRSLGKLRRR